MNKSTLLKILSLLPHFLFRRVVQYFKLDNQKKNLSFEHSIETKKSILKSLFEGESELFLKYIQNSNYYGEYGSGLSTIYVSNFSTVKAISAETDILWINKIKDNLSSEQIKRLDALGFVWEVRTKKSTRISWEYWFSLLELFKEFNLGWRF